jgi:hypothetical protein
MPKPQWSLSSLPSAVPTLLFHPSSGFLSSGPSQPVVTVVCLSVIPLRQWDGDSVYSPLCPRTLCSSQHIENTQQIFDGWKIQGRNAGRREHLGGCLILKELHLRATVRAKSKGSRSPAEGSRELRTSNSSEGWPIPRHRVFLRLWMGRTTCQGGEDSDTKKSGHMVVRWHGMHRRTLNQTERCESTKKQDNSPLPQWTQNNWDGLCLWDRTSSESPQSWPQERMSLNWPQGLPLKREAIDEEQTQISTQSGSLTGS